MESMPMLLDVSAIGGLTDDELLVLCVANIRNGIVLDSSFKKLFDSEKRER